MANELYEKIPVRKIDTLSTVGCIRAAINSYDKIAKTTRKEDVRQGALKRAENLKISLKHLIRNCIAVAKQSEKENNARLRYDLVPLIENNFRELSLSRLNVVLANHGKEGITGRGLNERDGLSFTLDLLEGKKGINFMTIVKTLTTTSALAFLIPGIVEMGAVPVIAKAALAVFNFSPVGAICLGALGVASLVKLTTKIFGPEIKSLFNHIRKNNELNRSFRALDVNGRYIRQENVGPNSYEDAFDPDKFIDNAKTYNPEQESDEDEFDADGFVRRNKNEPTEDEKKGSGETPKKEEPKKEEPVKEETPEEEEEEAQEEPEETPEKKETGDTKKDPKTTPENENPEQKTGLDETTKQLLTQYIHQLDALQSTVSDQVKSVRNLMGQLSQLSDKVSKTNDVTQLEGEIRSFLHTSEIVGNLITELKTNNKALRDLACAYKPTPAIETFFVEKTGHKYSDIQKTIIDGYRKIETACSKYYDTLDSESSKLEDRLKKLKNSNPEKESGNKGKGTGETPEKEESKKEETPKEKETEEPTTPENESDDKEDKDKGKKRGLFGGIFGKRKGKGEKPEQETEEPEQETNESEQENSEELENEGETPKKKTFGEKVSETVNTVGGAFAKGAKAVSGAVVKGAKAVGGAVAKGAKAVGGAVKGAAETVDKIAGKKWDAIKGMFVQEEDTPEDYSKDNANKQGRREKFDLLQDKMNPESKKYVGERTAETLSQGFKDFKASLNGVFAMIGDPKTSEEDILKAMQTLRSLAKNKELVDGNPEADGKTKPKHPRVHLYEGLYDILEQIVITKKKTKKGEKVSIKKDLDKEAALAEFTGRSGLTDEQLKILMDQGPKQE